ncbi:hypothetical protein Lesp02_03320 [Lentzea sp. NBRC 105346]|uniref:C40 family peptidase n=1 Tax=Lentzea sp. NBRC 105346 TaxID=3032205 RepID=UPI0024A5809B|nr:NlpC/P60 family protein [Lentzea sp. NBRC 105346]GLZ28142.1 hypothetical protein Lesp02_03320 [Lentzea sp. NBRC 105346]
MLKTAFTAVGGLLGVVLLIFVLTMGAGTETGQAAPAGGCTVPLDGTSPSSSAAATAGHQVDATLNDKQMAVARTIIAVGKGMGVAERGTAIALGTAMQESTLDPNATSGRSIGLFQQQGELYAAVRRTDPSDTSRAFYEQLLKRVPEYANASVISFADAAQRVQASGAGPSWYARWEAWAAKLAAQLYTGTPAQNAGTGDVSCTPGGGSGPIRITINGNTITLPAEAGISGTLTFPHEKATTAAAAALSYLGTPYAWGGGTPNGPSKGIHDGGVADAHGDYEKTGFDCSGLMVYAFAQAGIALPRTTQPQQQYGKSVPWAKAEPGDLLFWGRPATHVALYLGTINDAPYMVEAPSSGGVVKISLVRTRDPGFDAMVVRAS